MPESLDQILARKKGTKTLEQILAEGRGYSAPEGLNEPPPSGTPAEFDLMRNAGNESEQNQMLLEGSLMGIGALAGGVGGEALGARLIPKVGMEAPRLIRLLATAGRIAPEITGEAAGTYSGGRLAGMPHEEAKNAALVSGGAGLVGRTIARVGTRVAGRFAGMRPETTQAGIDNPALLNAPEPDAELAQAHRLRAQLDAQAQEITPYHRAYQDEFLGPLKNAKLDVKSYADIIRSQITGGDHPSIRSADRALETLANRLEGRAIPNPPEVVQIGESRYSQPTKRFQNPSGEHVMGRYMVDKTLPPTSSGKMEAGAVDAWIRENLTDPLHGAYTRGSEAIMAERLMKIRAAMADKLYTSLGPGAGSAQELAAHQISVREAAENTFPVGTKAKPVATGAERIRTIMSDTGEAQKNRAVLAAYDEEYGTHHLEDAKQLAMQREWQGKSMEKALAIDSVLQPQRPGFVRGAALPVARTGARIARVAGPITASVVAGTQAEKKKRKKVPQ